jgi:tetratricopeptide (TPR) repeat protein
LRHLLGLSYLRAGLPEAEGHFLQMEHLTRRRAAQPLRSLAWRCLGMARRVLGEWQRAEAAYQKAIAAASEAADRQQALRGLGHSYRLAGRHDEALLALGQAARAIEAERLAGRSWVYVDIAAAHLLRHDQPAARAALAQATGHSREDRERQTIVEAELARRAGDSASALALLQPLLLPAPAPFSAAISQPQPESLWLREERRAFPALFALSALPVAGAAFNQAQQTRSETRSETRAENTVKVQACPTLQVWVNGRLLPLSSTARAGELLVLLLEQGKAAPGETLREYLFPSPSDLPKRRQQQKLWAWAKELRDLLGWHAAVTVSHGVYRLDPNANWDDYDGLRLRQSQQPVAGFLGGIYSNWVRELEQSFVVVGYDLN